MLTTVVHLQILIGLLWRLNHSSSKQGCCRALCQHLCGRPFSCAYLPTTPRPVCAQSAGRKQTFTQNMHHFRELLTSSHFGLEDLLSLKLAHRLLRLRETFTPIFNFLHFLVFESGFRTCRTDDRMVVTRNVPYQPVICLRGLGLVFEAPGGQRAVALALALVSNPWPCSWPWDAVLCQTVNSSKFHFYWHSFTYTARDSLLILWLTSDSSSLNASRNLS